jgi:hypothetical protein
MSARVGGRGYGKSREEIETIVTSGGGQKRTQGKSLWNLEGMNFFHREEKKWKQVYDNKKDMRVCVCVLGHWL